MTLKRKYYRFMKGDIIRFIKKYAPKFGLGAYYLPDNDCYVLHRNGRAVQNFDSNSFYQIPKLARQRMFNPLIKAGLAQNLGEKHKDQFILNRKFGIKII